MILKPLWTRRLYTFITVYFSKHPTTTIEDQHEIPTTNDQHASEGTAADDIVQPRTSFVVSSPLPQNGEYSYVRTIGEEYRNTTGHRGSASERNGEGYEYIDMEEIIAITNEQSPQSSRITQAQSPLDGINLQQPPQPLASSSNIQMRNRKKEECADHDVQQSGSSSSSEGYLQPVNASGEGESGRESEGSSYEYSDDTVVQYNSNRQSYADLGPRPPHVPTVYDRLRHSRLDTDE